MPGRPAQANGSASSDEYAAVPQLPPTFRSRPRLLSALDRGAESALTLVSAPAGFGKSSLLVDWVTSGRVEGGVAWVTCERDEPAAVWRLVLERLGAAAPGSALARLQPAPLGSNAEVGMALVAHLRDLRQPITLILDDFHEARDEELLATLARLVRKDCPALRLVIATRADPGLPLARLRLTDDLTEIRAADLAFTVGELRSLFVGGLWAPSEAAADLLLARTEGWPAGVRLAMLSLGGAADPDEFIRTLAGDDHAIAAYLFEEVVDDQSPEVRRFLLEMSVLDRIDAQLAEHVTGIPGAGRLLGHLARHNVFIEAVDAHGTAFRFHRLFRELLRNEAHQEIRDRLPELHLRAARWFCEHRQPLEALRHARSAEDWTLVTDILVSDAMGLVLEGHADTVLDTLRSLPPERASDPELLSTAAMVAAEAGDRQYVVTCLERLAAASVDVPPARRPRFELARTVAELSRLAPAADLAEVRAATGAVVGALGAMPDDLPDVLRHRVVALLRLGVAESAMAPDDDDGEHHLQAALTGAMTIGQPYLALAASAELALRYARGLKLEAASTQARSALQIADPAGWTTCAPALAAHLALAIVGLETGDHQGAAEALESAGRALGREGTDRRLRALHALLGTRLAEVPRAQRITTYRTISGDTAGVPTAEREIAEYLQAGLGEGPEATTPAREDGVLGRRWEFVRARRLLAQGHTDEAAGVLDALTASRPGDRWPYAHADALILTAMIAEQRHAQTTVFTSLEDALDVAEHTGAVRPFVDGGRSVMALLKAHARSATAHRRAVLDVLAAFEGAPRSRAAVLLEPLTTREESILRYLSTELSGEDIAGELYISLNTVKTHLRSIYRKLDASSRRQAVANARELGLAAPRRRG